MAGILRSPELTPVKLTRCSDHTRSVAMSKALWVESRFSPRKYRERKEWLLPTSRAKARSEYPELRDWRASNSRISMSLEVGRGPADAPLAVVSSVCKITPRPFLTVP